MTDTEYTKESIEAYKAALNDTLEDAKEVYGNEKATQDEVDNAVKALNSKFKDAQKLLEKVAVDPDQRK